MCLVLTASFVSTYVLVLVLKHFSLQCRFLKGVSTVLGPLHQLLHKDCKWQWTNIEDESFQKSKELLLSTQLLVHYNAKRPLVLSCDASAYGIGAVLAQVMEDGAEKPVAFASRSLNHVEKGYSQIEKEGLASFFGVTKFHTYLYGRTFQLVTDHKPLITLFNERKAIPTQAAVRIQRWALKLASYYCSIHFKPAARHCNADAFRRLPLPDKPKQVIIPGDTILLMETLDKSPTSSVDIARWTRFYHRSTSSHLMVGLQNGQQNCNLMLCADMSCQCTKGASSGEPEWWYHPQAGNCCLKELHNGHPGISKMKALSKVHVWWPNMDRDIETLVQTCYE